MIKMLISLVRRHPIKTERKHCIFGDYIHTGTKQILGDVSDDAVTEIRDYNALWVRYALEVSGEWGGIPTKKGFEEWLQHQIQQQKITKEVINGE